MNLDRIWTIGLVAGIALVAVLGYFLGISPVLASASSANDQATSITASNTTSQAELVSLKAKFANIAELQSKLGTLRESIPTNADMSAFVQEINSLTDSTDVKLTSFTVDAGTAFQSATSPSATTPATGTSSSTDTSTPTPTPSAAASGTAVATPTTPAVSPTTMVTIPVKFAFSGSFDQVMKFIDGVQGGPRLFFASQITTQKGAGSKAVDATIQGDVFALQGVSGTLPASATPAAPTPTPTDTATPNPTDSSTTTPTPTGTPTP